MKVCVAPFHVLRNPRLAGHLWVYLNWALGIQANGCRVTILESPRQDASAHEVPDQVRRLKSALSSVGLDSDLALLLSDAQREALRDVRDEIDSLTVPFDKVADESELLVNFRYSMAGDVLRRFKRAVLIDIDPGLLQVWMSENQLTVHRHDMYFTIGETVGRPGAAFPDCGLAWLYTPPVVYLPAWPPTACNGEAPYTTVSGWYTGYLRLRGEIFDNRKQTAFRGYIGLPAQTPVSLELALCLSDDGRDDVERRRLEENGWGVRHSYDVSSDVEQYRSYIQASRGEFGCVKPSCVRFENAWISDRTLCYLASGKPAVVQHTGPSRFLPDSAGLFRFRDMREAVQAFETIESDYEKQSRLARSLAEEHFDARKLTGKLLEQALSVTARQPG